MGKAIFGLLATILILGCRKEPTITPKCYEYIRYTARITPYVWSELKYYKNGKEITLQPSEWRNGLDVSFIQDKGYKNGISVRNQQGIVTKYITMRIDGILIDSLYDNTINHKLEIVR